MTPVPIPPPAEAAKIVRRVSEGPAAAVDTLAMLDAEAADAARLKSDVAASDKPNRRRRIAKD